MKNFQLKKLSVLFLILLLSLSVYAQMQLGRATLLHAKAPALMNPMHLSSGLSNPGFVSGVGGVVFDAVASPNENITLDNLQMDYLPEEADGKRLVLNINGQNIETHIYDWQLIPIAKYADSKYYSVFTLFGDLDDENLQDSLVEQGYRILNYHPAFENTLMGLRLFELDILIISDISVDLPEIDGKYILGKGEIPPKIFENTLGALKAQSFLQDSVQNVFGEYRSYIINDYQRDIRFNIENSKLNITGEPYYYLWHYQSDRGGLNSENSDSVYTEIFSEVYAEIESELDAAINRNYLSFDEKEWIIRKILEITDDFEEGFAFMQDTVIQDYLEHNDRNTRNSYLHRMDVEHLYMLFFNMRIVLKAFRIVHLENASEKISENIDLIKNINPAVWKAGVITMRYSAFFRYIKENFPLQWNSFMKKIQDVEIEPEVETPSIMYIPEIEE